MIVRERTELAYRLGRRRRALVVPSQRGQARLLQYKIARVRAGNAHDGYDREGGM